MENIKLTALSQAAGCAAKLDPNILRGILTKLPKNDDKNLIVGVETADDAAVYKISEDIAIVQTLDFFPPMTDNPYVFGQIAAANALSDIYAMGGEPIVALNIVAYPSCLGEEILTEILRGGADKVKEAGASIAGGHSINDQEPKYGLSVTGIVNPNRILRNVGARMGDILILTKPIGAGLINTAVKADLASEEARKEVESYMTMLNKTAKQVFERFDIHACTDVTGFGLAGHALEMAEASGVSIEIAVKALPVMEEALSYAEMGLVPEGTYRNRSFVGTKTDFSEITEKYIDLVCDPQTSGGLMVSVSKEHSQAVMTELKVALPHNKFAIIGRVKNKIPKHMAFVGAGGKSTMISILAEALAEAGKKVIITTSTHIYRPDHMPVAETQEELKKLISENKIVVVGKTCEAAETNTKIKLTAVDDEFSQSLQEYADFVLTEADGARGLSIKVPREHEPVIPSGADMVVAVVGLDCVGEKLKKSCFAYEAAEKVLSEALGYKVGEEHIITEQDVAEILASEEGMRKNVGNRDFKVVLNKVDTDKSYEQAESIKKLLAERGIYDCVMIWKMEEGI